jgi:hypothetical protein
MVVYLEKHKKQINVISGQIAEFDTKAASTTTSWRITECYSEHVATYTFLWKSAKMRLLIYVKTVLDRLNSFFGPINFTILILGC